MSGDVEHYTPPSWTAITVSQLPSASRTVYGTTSATPVSTKPGRTTHGTLYGANHASAVDYIDFSACASTDDGGGDGW